MGAQTYSRTYALHIIANLAYLALHCERKDSVLELGEERENVSVREIKMGQFPLRWFLRIMWLNYRTVAFSRSFYILPQVVKVKSHGWVTACNF